MKKLACFCFFFLCSWSYLCLDGCIFGDKAHSVPYYTLSLRIPEIAQDAKGIVGISIENLETGDTLSYNGTYHCPMQSVFKFPIALAILNMVDKGTLSLEDKIHLTKEDLSDTTTMSPLRDKYFNRDTSLATSELLRFMVSESDNIACDILLKKAGGAKQVEDFIHSLGVTGIAIAATEKEMHANTKLQYESWCEATEMTHLLKLFYQGKCVSKSSTDFLMKIMEGTETGAKRIKGLLPKGTVVAHKTGSSMTEQGLAAATNDAGIITLPNGKHLIITVFVTDSKADFDTREAVIARVAKAAYDVMDK
jgi:beta-lactamase class A